MPRLHSIRLRTVVTVAVGALAFAGAGLADSHSNSGTIAVPDSPGGGSVGSAPVSQVDVSGEPTVTRVSVQLWGFAHPEPDDVDVLVVGPDGTQVVLMSDAGGDNSVGGIDLNFDDDASSILSDEGVLSSGNYPPSNYDASTSLPGCAGEPATDVFPLAPAGTVSPMLSAFQGSDPNGTWSLYVVDDCGGFSGSVQGGWTVNVNPPPLAVGVARFGARAFTGRVALSWRSANETNLLGYNVYRTGPGRTARLNSRLISARFAGSSRGAAYRLVDARVRPGVSYTYRLQVVHLDGSRAWAGSSALNAR